MSILIYLRDVIIVAAAMFALSELFLRLLDLGALLSSIPDRLRWSSKVREVIKLLHQRNAERRADYLKRFPARTPEVKSRLRTLLRAPSMEEWLRQGDGHRTMTLWWGLAPRLDTLWLDLRTRERKTKGIELGSIKNALEALGGLIKEGAPAPVVDAEIFGVHEELYCYQEEIRYIPLLAPPKCDEDMDALEREWHKFMEALEQPQETHEWLYDETVDAAQAGGVHRSWHADHPFARMTLRPREVREEFARLLFDPIALQEKFNEDRNIDVGINRRVKALAEYRQSIKMLLTRVEALPVSSLEEDPAILKAPLKEALNLLSIIQQGVPDLDDPRVLGDLEGEGRTTVETFEEAVTKAERVARV